MLAGIVWWVLGRTTDIVENSTRADTAEAATSTSVDILGWIFLVLLSLIAWYFVANFARKLVWSMKRYISVSSTKFQALLMLDLTIAWLLIGGGLFVAGHDPALIFYAVGGFMVIGYVSLALEFYLRALWNLPLK